MSGGRRTRSVGRKVTSQAKKFQVLIFAEGEKTEEIYVNHWWRKHRERVVVSFADYRGSAPMKLVEAATAQRTADLRDARKGKGDAYDEYWCVFDVDQHPRLADAIALAEEDGIKVALSSPCLEVWFLIHFDAQTANLDRYEAQHRVKALLNCDKVPTAAALQLLEERYEVAKKHAQALDRKHLGDGASHPWNPCSNIWELIETIKNAASLADSGVPCSCWHLR
jgi:hypothetical protein